jgi:hypothetical protein
MVTACSGERKESVVSGCTDMATPSFGQGIRLATPVLSKNEWNGLLLAGGQALPRATNSRSHLSLRYRHNELFFADEN